MTKTRRAHTFTPRAGVYRITHLPSGRTLLGASMHAQGMLNRIQFQLTTRLETPSTINGHHLKALQRDWTTDGEAAFRFEVLDELEPDASGGVAPDDLADLLNLWRAQLALPPESLY
ncbi:GIY-YIG nuclease family protein [Deinococcus sonorensis]|uniref:GIY-YIG nuclease family protein n=2 Tax=Deinococcus sonorensis TaxID=309891 RepID=A0AAU7U5S0_9DEIO